MTKTNDSISKRQQMEQRIARRLIADAIKAGYEISVYDGAEFTLEESSHPGRILSHMFTTDEDYLYLCRNGQRVGWVRFIYGNDGWDVINDMTMNIEDVVAGADKLADQLETASR